MNKNIRILLAALLVSTSPISFGQQNSDIARKLNYLQAEVTSLELQLSAQQLLSAELAQKVRQSAATNNQIASDLKNNAANKQTAKSARKSARRALKDAGQAGKAHAKLIALQDQIRQKKEQISSLESRPTIVSALPLMPETAPIADRSDTVGVTTGRSGAGNIAEKVVEATYKAYRQQPGQPSIVINNIITPTAYPESSKSRVMDEERTADRQWNNYRVPPAGNPPAESARISAAASRWQQKMVNKSGVWIVPVAGLHASGFHADFKDSKATGRTGWNAGLDFRIHMRRFFIQPGVHYMNSSLDLASKDSLEHARFLSGPRMQSLKVPVIAGVYLTRAQHAFFKINVKAGVSGNYLLAVQRNMYQQFDRDNLQTYSYGLAAGIGLEFGLLTLDASHEWGMSRIFKDNNTKNNILRLTLGLRL